MKLLRPNGATSEVWQLFIQDSSSIVGAGLTGLTSGSGGLTAYYHRDTDTTATAINLVTMTVGTYTSGGFKEIDSVHMPGWYQFCPPNAAFAAVSHSVAFHLQGATNMAPLPIEVDLAAEVILAPTGMDLVNIAGKTAPQALRYIGAACVGLLPAGAGTGQENFLDFAGNPCVNVTVDSAGNRTVIVYN